MQIEEEKSQEDVKSIYIKLLEQEQQKQKLKTYLLMKQKLQKITNKNIAFTIVNKYVKTNVNKNNDILTSQNYSEKSELVKLITTQRKHFIDWNFLVLREMYQNDFCDECKDNLLNIWNNTLKNKHTFLKAFANGKAEFAYTFHDDYTEEGMDYDGGGEYFSGVTLYGRAYNFRVGLHIQEWINSDEEFGEVNSLFEEQMQKNFVIKKYEFPEKISNVQCEANEEDDDDEDDEDEEEGKQKTKYRCPDYLNTANEIIMEVYHQRDKDNFYK